MCLQEESILINGVAKSSTKTAQKKYKRSTKITLYFGGVFREKLFPCINFLGVGVGGSGGNFFFGLQKIGEFFFLLRLLGVCACCDGVTLR